MSKYTTEVRFICEQKSGLEESVGFANVDNVLNNAWDKIFTTRCKFFDESYRPVLCKKILKHYYTREICAETVGLWQLWLNTKLEEIMPYYNQLYRSELLQFEPLQNIHLTKTKDIEGNETGSKRSAGSVERSVDLSGNDRVVEDNSNTTLNTGTGSGTSAVTDEREDNKTKTGGSRNAFSDTPQSYLGNVDDYRYLTDYRRITEEGSEQDTSEGETNTTNSYSDRNEGSLLEDKEKNIIYGKETDISEGREGSEHTTLETTQDYLETLVGNNGNYSNSRLLQEFRDTFLNIDMMVIGEFKGLFMGLW